MSLQEMSYRSVSGHYHVLYLCDLVSCVNDMFTFRFRGNMLMVV